MSESVYVEFAKSITVIILYTHKRHFREAVDVSSVCETQFLVSEEVQDLLLVITKAVSMCLG